MTTLSRRSFLEMAIALGATAAWRQPLAIRSSVPWMRRFSKVILSFPSE